MSDGGYSIGSGNRGVAQGANAYASAGDGDTTITYASPALSADELKEALRLAGPGTAAYSLIGNLHVNIGGPLSGAPEVIQTVKDCIAGAKRLFGR
jgi:hypothetical protein